MSKQNHEGRTILIQKINDQLSRLTTVVQTEVKNNLSSRNVVAESILAGFLNRIEGWKLINANRIRSNYPAVDLVDRDSRVAVQISSTNDLKKIDHTLEEFQKNQLEAEYDKVYVITITTDNPTPAMKARQLGTVFSGSSHIWNMPTLSGKLLDLDISVLEDIHAYMSLELGRFDPLGRYLYLPTRSAVGDGFVGREAELDTIGKQLAGGVKPIVLSGLGGMGKTELAAKFGREYQTGAVYFIHFQGSFESTVRSMFTGVFPQPAQPPKENEQFDTVMNLLRRCTENDLLIVDNVDAGSGTLADLMKDPVYQNLLGMKLRLLLTTRFDWNRVLPVAPLPREELYEIFRTHGTVLEKRQMDDLIDAVNAHTMTIDLIARTLNGKGWRRVTAEDMLRAIRENTLPDEKYRKIATDYNQSREQAQIYQHLSVVFDVSGIPEVGRDVLRCATLLPESGMDGELFGYSLTEQQQDALDDLLNHGWLSMEQERIQIHPIIRLVCREELKPSEESCGEFLDALWKQYDDKSYNTDRYSQMAETFSAAALGELTEKKADWINSAGAIWNKLVQSQKAKALYEKYLPSLEKQFPEHPALAAAYNNAGNSYRQLGDHKGALEFRLKTIEILKKVLHQEHPDLANAYINIGVTYGELGDYKQAIAYVMVALSIAVKVLPSDHPDLANCYNCVGWIYNELGEHKKALQYHKEALKIRKKTLPHDHPLLANTYNNMGLTYGDLENHEQALKYLLQALEIRKKVLPPEHPNLANSYDNVGGAYGDLGNHEQALEFQQTAMKIREKSLHQEHPELAKSYNNIGSTYSDLGNHMQALRFLRKALVIREKILPPTHPDLAQSYNNLGNVYGVLGQYDKALAYLKKSLAICEDSLPVGHPKTNTVRQAISICHMMQSRTNNSVNFTNPFASRIPPKK